MPTPSAPHDPAVDLLIVSLLRAANHIDLEMRARVRPLEQVQFMIEWQDALISHADWLNASQETRFRAWVTRTRPANEV